MCERENGVDYQNKKVILFFLTIITICPLQRSIKTNSFFVRFEKMLFCTTFVWLGVNFTSNHLVWWNRRGTNVSRDNQSTRLGAHCVSGWLFANFRCFHNTVFQLGTFYKMCPGPACVPLPLLWRHILNFSKIFFLAFGV